MTDVVALLLVGASLGAFMAAARSPRVAVLAVVGVGLAIGVGANSAWGEYHDAPPWQVFVAASIYAAVLLAVGAIVGRVLMRRTRRPNI